MPLWEDFLAKLHEADYTWEDVVGSSDDAIPAILEELGFRSALHRAKLHTQWKQRRGELNDDSRFLASGTLTDGFAQVASAPAGSQQATEEDEEPLTARHRKLKEEKKGKRPRGGEAEGDKPGVPQKARKSQAREAPSSADAPVSSNAPTPRPKRAAPSASQLVHCPVAAPPPTLGPDALHVPLPPLAAPSAPRSVGLDAAKFCVCGYYVMPSDRQCPSCASSVLTGPRAFHSLFRPQANRLDVVDEFRTKTADHRSMTLAFCEKCWKTTRCYTDSLQTRSADEGLTTFYSCSVCKYNWLEYS